MNSDRKRPNRRESIFFRTIDRFSRFLSTKGRWDRWHKYLGAMVLKVLRDDLRDKNLADTRRWDLANNPTPVERGPYPEHEKDVRSPDGSRNDLTDPGMGMAGSSFGRNLPLEEVVPVEDRNILIPNPREVSRQLMSRGSNDLKKAESLNVLAAGWIQFMIHDWFAHETDASKQHIKIPIESGDNDWQGEDKAEMTVFPTKELGCVHLANKGKIPTYANRQSHWWNGSQLYGASKASQDRVRTGENGYLHFDKDAGIIPTDKDGVELTGVTDNMWIGLGAMHLLFVQEHNSICDMLKSHHSDWNDQRLFDVARLINTALMARIHTIEWTPTILGHDTLQVSMNANWWGLLGKDLKKLVQFRSSEILSGIIGSPVDHHADNFSLTEEFVSVYRMHPLLPDQFKLHRPGEAKEQKTYPLEEVSLENSHKRFEDKHEGGSAWIYSMGIANPGAITLNNYPKFLQSLPRGKGRTVDLAAVDILRDRERGVPRYNAFRKMLRLEPFGSFEEISADPEIVATLKNLYDDVDEVDTMVGLFAEELPKGFGFSDTAFRVFILMASRRLKSDRFFCEDYREEIYTKEGLEWIDETDFGTVVGRHYEELRGHFDYGGKRSAFKPWKP